jgi:hypothetical protein
VQELAHLGAAHAIGRLTHLLHGGQQQPDQDRNDGDDYEQLDQREAGPTTPYDRNAWGLAASAAGTKVTRALSAGFP